MRRKKGISLIEILVISFVIIVLAVIIVPIIARIIERNYYRRNSRGSTCTSNQRQIVSSLQMIAQDHNDLFPLSTTIWSDIKVDPGVLICPTTGKKLPNAYLYNNKLQGVNVTKIEDPTSIFATVDGETIYNSNIYYSPSDVQYRHYDKAIASFADGHVESISKTDAKLPWDLPVKMVVEKPVVKKKKMGHKK